LELYHAGIWREFDIGAIYIDSCAEAGRLGQRYMYMWRRLPHTIRMYAHVDTTFVRLHQRRMSLVSQFVVIARAPSIATACGRHGRFIALVTTREWTATGEIEASTAKPGAITRKSGER